MQIDDSFSFRDGEGFRLEPLTDAHDYAVRVLPCSPPGEMVVVSTAPTNIGQPVEHAAIVASFRRKTQDGDDGDEGKWSWLSLAPGTKGAIGSILFDIDHRDEWVGMTLTKKEDAR